MSKEALQVVIPEIKGALAEWIHLQERSTDTANFNGTRAIELNVDVALVYSLTTKLAQYLEVAYILGERGPTSNQALIVLQSITRLFELLSERTRAELHTVLEQVLRLEKNELSNHTVVVNGTTVGQMILRSNGGTQPAQHELLIPENFSKEDMRMEKLFAAFIISGTLSFKDILREIVSIPITRDYFSDLDKKVEKVLEQLSAWLKVRNLDTIINGYSIDVKAEKASVNLASMIEIPFSLERDEVTILDEKFRLSKQQRELVTVLLSQVDNDGWIDQATLVEKLQALGWAHPNKNVHFKVSEIYYRLTYQDQNVSFHIPLLEVEHESDSEIILKRVRINPRFKLVQLPAKHA